MPLRRNGRVGLAVFVIAAAAACGSLRPALHLPCVQPPASVVLLIGDGLGDAEIVAARNYLVGAAGALVLETLPVHARLTTYAVQETAPELPDYVIDSAASATAWATGHKTSVGRLSTAPGTDVPLVTLAERCREHGVPVGMVTTAEVTDATPAALVAHVNSRICQGPADMNACPQFRHDRGGPGSVAEQIVAQRFDLVLGGGRQRFEQSVEVAGGRTRLLDVARSRGFTVIEDAADLHEDLRPPVLGLFAAGDFDRLWRGEPARPFPGSGPQRCDYAGRPAAQPSLEAMTRAALAWLHAESRQRGGRFFLQVEGANIDKCAHAADPCCQIGETEEFDRTVALVLRYAQQQRNTLVLVTADHAHATQIVPHPLAGARNPGLLSTLVTREGALLSLAYATAAVGAWQTHTGTDVSLFAFGPGSERVPGRLDQTALFGLMAKSLGLDSEPCPASR